MKSNDLTKSIVATAFVVQESDSKLGKAGGPEGRVYYPLNLGENSILKVGSLIWSLICHN